MTQLEDWLTPRLESAPASLRERILRALSDQHLGTPGLALGSDEDRAGALRRLAEDLLAQAKAGPPTRDTALTLLAADALITFAMEAESEA